MQLSKLFLLTNNYPYGKGETFIENEINILAQNFEKIYIISLNSRDLKEREVPNNVVVKRIKLKSFKNILSSFFSIFIDINYFKRFDIRIIDLKEIIIFRYISKILEKTIIEIIKKEKYLANDICVYSYWFKSGAHAASVLKKKKIVLRAITRAHRYDLYEDEKFKSLKEEVLENIDCVYSCSLDGEEYLKELYMKKNIKTSYLGTINFENFKLKEKSLKIVSCSNLISLKRVELIIAALEEVEKKYKNLTWIHFGSGKQEKNLKELSENKLKDIKYEFKGHISNKELLEYYKNNDILFFIHLSSSEGLPVSMMEVQSYGVPIIATNVGGVKEIVNNKTGILLSDNPTISEITKAIESMINCSKERYIEYQINSYNNWKEKFDAIKNYNDFIKEIKKC